VAIWKMCVLLALASCASTPTATTAPPRSSAESAARPAEATEPAPAAPPADRPDGKVTVTPPVRISGDPNVVPPDSVKQAMVSARQSLLTGAFKVCVDLDGSVTAVTALSPSGHPDFDRLVIERAKTWQYRPGLLDGEPTRVCTGVTLVYYQPAFSAAGMRLSGLHQHVFDAIAAAPDCRRRELLLHQFARQHVADIAAVDREIEAYDARRAPAGSANRPHTGFSEELLRRTAPYVATCDNEEALITALFDAGFRPASR
jgi:TonB family protein